jgi:hypothetical protein
MTKSIEKHVTLTSEYRLTSDGERNLTLERRVTVDPTKGPGFEKRNESAIAETGVGLSVELREEWREADAGHYAFNSAGLTALLSSVALRTAWNSVGEGLSSGLTIGDFAADLTEEYRKLTAAVSGVFPEVSV